MMCIIYENIKVVWCEVAVTLILGDNLAHSSDFYFIFRPFLFDVKWNKVDVFALKDIKHVLRFVIGNMKSRIRIRTTQ